MEEDPQQVQDQPALFLSVPFPSSSPVEKKGVYLCGRGAMALNNPGLKFLQGLEPQPALPLSQPAPEGFFAADTDGQRQQGGVQYT